MTNRPLQRLGETLRKAGHAIKEHPLLTTMVGVATVGAVENVLVGRPGWVMFETLVATGFADAATDFSIARRLGNAFKEHPVYMTLMGLDAAGAVMNGLSHHYGVAALEAATTVALSAPALNSSIAERWNEGIAELSNKAESSAIVRHVRNWMPKLG